MKDEEIQGRFWVIGAEIEALLKEQERFSKEMASHWNHFDLALKDIKARLDKLEKIAL